jgi:hypothetical protein
LLLSCLRGGLPGVARRLVTFLLRQKRVTQKRRPQAAALRVPTEAMPRSGSETNSLRSDMFRFFIRTRHRFSDSVPSGFHTSSATRVRKNYFFEKSRNEKRQNQSKRFHFRRSALSPQSRGCQLALRGVNSAWDAAVVTVRRADKERNMSERSELVSLPARRTVFTGTRRAAACGRLSLVTFLWRSKESD